MTSRKTKYSRREVQLENSSYIISNVRPLIAIITGDILCPDQVWEIVFLHNGFSCIENRQISAIVTV
ncbi:hypothetical protein [Pedobacter antarcticus]|uniref:hypothetical protein n=1 Tax=Pedobacter antarcticus TaxID=34086 RepID=UPI00115FBBBD|nr:hypothetical protein [Pedobacter antarcticus]